MTALAPRSMARAGCITRHNLRRDKPEGLIEEIEAVRVVCPVAARTSQKGQALLLPEYEV